MKYYLFIDESGDHGLKNINPNFPVLVLCGILISSGHYKLFTDRLNQLKLDIFGTIDVVLHSTEIRKKEGVFSCLWDSELNAKFIVGFNKIIVDSKFLILSTAIRKEAYKDRYQNQFHDIYARALTFIVERTVYTLNDVRFLNPELSVRFESRGGLEDKKLAKFVDNLRANGTYYVKGEAFRYYGFDYWFQPKKENSAGLQLADLIAYPIARHVLQAYDTNVMFELLRPKFQSHYLKGIYGYGLKIFP